MGGNPRFGHEMHGFRAHLELHVDAGGADQGRVQRLIAIHFGDGNMVFELAGYRFVQLMQDAQRGVAVDNRRNNQSQTVNVGNLRETEVFAVHFSINGVERLFPAGDSNGHAGFCECKFNVFLYFLYEIAASAAGFCHCFCQCFVTPWPQMLERQVLQLTVGGIQPQAMGDGCVNIQGFRGNAGPLGFGHVR